MLFVNYYIVYSIWDVCNFYRYKYSIKDIVGKIIFVLINCNYLDIFVIINNFNF